MIRTNRRSNSREGQNNLDDTDGTSWTKRRIYMAITVVIVTICSLVCTQVPLFGNAELNNGIDVMRDGLDYTEDLFNELIDDGNNLVDNGNTLLEQLDTASNTGCPVANNFNDNVENYIDSAQDYLDIVEPIPNEISFIHDGVERWGVDFKNDTIWVMYAVMMTTIVMLLTGGILQKRCCCLFPAQILAQPMLVIYFIFVTVVMIVLIGWADFCMEPINNIIDILPKENSDTTTYYITCEGESPIQEDLDEAAAAITLTEVGVQTLLATICAGNDALEDSLVTINTIQDTLDNVDDLAQCEPTKKELDNVLYNGFCKKSFRGVYVIWLGQYLSAAFLLLLLFTVSLSFWGYFHFSSVDEIKIHNNKSQSDVEMSGVGDEVQIVDAIVIHSSVYDNDHSKVLFPKKNNHNTPSAPPEDHDNIEQFSNSELSSNNSD